MAQQITTRDAAGLIGCGIASIGHLVRRGILPATRMASISNRPGEWLLEEEDVIRYALITPPFGSRSPTELRPAMKRPTEQRLVRNLRAKHGDAVDFAIYEADGVYLAYPVGSAGDREAGKRFRLVNKEK